MDNTQDQQERKREFSSTHWDAKEVFDLLSNYSVKGFASHGSIFGSLHEEELSELEEYLSQSGLVNYSYNSSFEHENTGPPWDYIVTKKGMEFYNQYKGAIK
jgi:hypothetical protein